MWNTDANLLLLELVVAEDGEALLGLLRGEALPGTPQVLEHLLQRDVLLQIPPPQDTSQRDHERKNKSEDNKEEGEIKIASLPDRQLP